MSIGPDIMALLQGAGAGGGMQGGMGMQGGGMQGGMMEQMAPGGGEQPVEIIRQIVDLCQQFLQAEPDEEDKLQGAKLLQLAQQLLAKDQQDKDAAMGGSNARILRKAG